MGVPQFGQNEEVGSGEFSICDEVVPDGRIVPAGGIELKLDDRVNDAESA